MKLSVYERLLLLNILPKEGDYTTLKILRVLKEDLSFSEEEHKALEFSQESGTSVVHWKTEGETMKEVLIGEKATDIIVGALKALDAKKKLQEEHMPLYERFVINEGK
jgi:hypothetical protein